MGKQTYFMEQLFDKEEIERFITVYGLFRHITSEQIVRKIMLKSRKWNMEEQNDEGFSIWLGRRNEHEIYVRSTWWEETETLEVELCPVLYGMCASEYDDNPSWNKVVYRECMKDRRL